jgi:hypothetical protein
MQEKKMGHSINMHQSIHPKVDQECINAVSRYRALAGLMPLVLEKQSN